MENLIPLCKKCFNDNNKKYTIPFINIKEKKIIYHCPYHNTLSKDLDIITKLINENIKEKITICNIHDNPISAWCYLCKENLCHLCISCQEKHKHDYVLFSIYIENILLNKEKINNKISSFDFILKKQNKENNIVLMKEIISLIKKYYNFYFINDIICFQIFKNLEILIEYLDKNELKLILYNDKFNEIIPLIKRKNLDKIEQTILAKQYNAKNMKIIPLNCELYDDIEKSDIGFFKNENAFLIYYYQENIINQIFYYYFIPRK